MGEVLAIVYAGVRLLGGFLLFAVASLLADHLHIPRGNFFNIFISVLVFSIINFIGYLIITKGTNRGTVASLLAAGGFVVIGTLLLFFNAPLFAILLFLILFDCFVVLIESLTAGALLFILLLILLIVFYQKILHLHGSDVYLYAGAYFFLSGELITGRYKKQKKQ